MFLYFFEIQASVIRNRKACLQSPFVAISSFFLKLPRVLDLLVLHNCLKFLFQTLCPGAN
jgi:hypothetical protein